MVEACPGGVGAPSSIGGLGGEAAASVSHHPPHAGVAEPSLSTAKGPGQRGQLGTLGTARADLRFHEIQRCCESRRYEKLWWVHILPSLPTRRPPSSLLMCEPWGFPKQGGWAHAGGQPRTRRKCPPRLCPAPPRPPPHPTPPLPRQLSSPLQPQGFKSTPNKSGQHVTPL